MAFLFLRVHFTSQFLIWKYFVYLWAPTGALYIMMWLPVLSGILIYRCIESGILGVYDDNFKAFVCLLKTHLMSINGSKIHKFCVLLWQGAESGWECLVRWCLSRFESVTWVLTFMIGHLESKKTNVAFWPSLVWTNLEATVLANLFLSHQSWWSW